MKRTARIHAALHWTVSLPVLAVVAVVVTWGSKPGTAVVIVGAFLLAGSVLAAVHHAEVVAHRVGEPFGSLVLAVAVTVIEVGLIVTLMSAAAATRPPGPRHGLRRGDDHLQRHRRALACSSAALRHRVASFNAGGRRRRAGHRRHHGRPSAWCCRRSRPAARPAVLRRPTRLRRRRVPGPLRAVRLRPDRPAPRLLPADRPAGRADRRGAHADPPTARDGADQPRPARGRAGRGGRPGQGRVSPSIEAGVARVGAPHTAVGVVIALLVLLPETIAAVRAAAPRPDADQPQPRVRLGDGQHRPDHPGHRRRLDLAARVRSCWASAAPRWFCSPSPRWSAPSPLSPAGPRPPGRRPPRPLRRLPLSGRQPIARALTGARSTR